MKIAELFAVLGFKIDGAEKLDAVKKEMTSVTGASVKGAIAINAVNVAFFAMIDTSIRAGQALRNFTLSTGLSSEDLQYWQHAAVVAGLTAEDMTAAIKGLQAARAGFDLGNPQSVGVWQLLGVSPLQDPIKVITALRARLASGNLNAGVARNLLGQVGLETLIPLLRSSNAEFEQWSKNFLVTEKQSAALARLNGAWQNLRTSIISVKTQFSAVFAPALAAVAKMLTAVAEKVAIVVRWLGESGLVSTVIRRGLIILVGLLVALGAALLAFSAAMGLAAGAIAIFEIVLSPLLGPILFVTVAIIALAAALVGVVLLIDDFVTAINGGQSLFKWNEGILLAYRNFLLLYTGIKPVVDLWQKLSALQNGIVGFGLKEIANAVVPSSAAGATSNVRQTNDIKIDVNGAQDPRATGREVWANLRSQIAAAAYQAPVPNY